MVSKGKARAATAIRVPQSRDEARDMLAEYGTALRDLEHIETELNQSLADLKKTFLDRSVPVAARAEELFKGLQTYCDANRATLTGNNAVKTVDLGTGNISWRWNPAKVSIRGKVEDVIARLKEGGEALAQFLRTTVEIDKVAMLRNPNLAKTVDGVRIGAAGATFTIEPFAAEQLESV